MATIAQRRCRRCSSGMRSTSLCCRGTRCALSLARITRLTMRILQLTPRLPNPPIDGGRVVMLQIARAMERLGNDVHVLSLNPRKQHGDSIDAIDIDTSAHTSAM